MLERKYLQHWIDSSFNGTTITYVRLGDDLEDYSIELNPSVEQFRNILGESKIRHQGYEPSGQVQPYYATTGDALFTHLYDIMDQRLTGDALLTTVVDVLVDETGNVVGATRESAKVVPISFGGDTSGVQIPFQIYYNGSRVKGTWNTSTHTFTPNAE